MNKGGLPSMNLDQECAKYLSEQCGTELKTSDEACVNQKVMDFIRKCIEATNQKAVSKAAHIKMFKLLTVDFSQPGGELTPTMKLKRKVTEKKYFQEIEEMYAVKGKL